MPKDFTIKDSGKRQQFETGMQRDTSEGKICYDLIIPVSGQGSMFKRWAEHMTKGAKKYEERNWEKASTHKELERFRRSAFRHFMQWFENMEDEDHAAACFFNIQGAEYTKARIKKKEEESLGLPKEENK